MRSFKTGQNKAKGPLLLPYKMMIVFGSTIAADKTAWFSRPVICLRDQESRKLRLGVWKTCLARPSVLSFSFNHPWPSGELLAHRLSLRKNDPCWQCSPVQPRMRTDQWPWNLSFSLIKLGLVPKIDFSFTFRDVVPHFLSIPSLAAAYWWPARSVLRQMGTLENWHPLSSVDEVGSNLTSGRKRGG